MVMNLNTGLTSVTGSVSVSSTQEKKTATCLNTDRSSSGTTTMGTVGANKVWRVLSANSSVTSTGARAESQILLNGIEITTAISAISGQAADSVTWNYYACPVLTAGQTIQYVLGLNGGTGYGYGSVSYVEEDV